MSYIKAKTLARVDVKTLLKFLTLASVLLVVPFFFHGQWIVGPLVNAILIIALFLVGLRLALFLSCLPSLMALSGGLLPAILTPAVPFIIMSNMVLVLIIYWIYNASGKNMFSYWFSLFLAATLKFLFLFLSLKAIIVLFNLRIPGAAVKLLSYPQFYTALIGGVFAFIVIKSVNRFRI